MCIPCPPAPTGCSVASNGLPGISSCFQIGGNGTCQMSDATGTYGYADNCYYSGGEEEEVELAE
ncbi:MAG: hypothetical protein LBD50_03275 [Rickettsiales bacterium]|nr:hypothetical protein [Rickettsiales bacterium]